MGEGEEADEELDEPSRKRKRESGCSCGDGVPQAWKARVMKSNKHDPVIGMNMLKDMVGHVNAGQRICYLHLKITASHNELQTNVLKIDQLLQRLQQVYANRDRFKDLKTDAAIYA